MGNKLDLTGERFGNLTVLNEVIQETYDKRHSIKWNCKCDCGNIVVKPTSKLRSGEAIMCKDCSIIQRSLKRYPDLTGKVYGELTVIGRTNAPDNVKKTKSYYWECRCSCGNTTVVSTSNLNSGHCTRCWSCAHYETNKYKRVDLVGKQFGDLTVLEMIYSDRSESKRTKCRCMCSCGNEVIRISDSLTKSNNPNCGCKSYEISLKTFSKDINGQKFGRLTIVDTIYDYENHTKPKVRCLCDCGNEVILNKKDVMCKHTQSCGCLQKDRASESNIKDWTGVISDTGVEFLNRSYKKKGVWMWDCKCPICNNIFTALPANIMDNTTTSCGCKIKSSYERITEGVLIENNLNYKSQYSFNDCKNKYKLKFDFVVFNNNNEVIFAIENDGKQHYEPIDYFGGEEGFLDIQLRDEIKNKYCETNNIHLLRLPYYLNKEQISEKIKNII